MKWLIGPRQVGKTHKLCQEFLEYRGQAFLYVTDRNQAHMVIIPILQKIIPGLTIDMNDLSFSWAGEKQIKIGSDFFIHKDIPKFIDNIDYFLYKQFGNVVCGSATGPIYKFKFSKELKKALKQIKTRMTQLEFFNEMTINWSRKDET